MNAECDGFAVVKDSDGQVMGCHRTLGQAERQMVALYAVEDDANEDEGPTHTMPDGTVMEGASHPRAEGYAPTSAMIAEATLGLKWREEYNRGGTEVGVARARDISNGSNLSLDTVNRMVSFFARHEVDKQGQGYTPDEDGYPSAGRIAWALWGGDPGRSWAEAIVDSTRNELDDVERLLRSLTPNRSHVEEMLASWRVSD